MLEDDMRGLRAWKGWFCDIILLQMQRKPSTEPPLHEDIVLPTPAPSPTPQHHPSPMENLHIFSGTAAFHSSLLVKFKKFGYFSWKSRLHLSKQQILRLRQCSYIKISIKQGNGGQTQRSCLLHGPFQQQIQIGSIKSPRPRRLRNLQHSQDQQTLIQHPELRCAIQRSVKQGPRTRLIHLRSKHHVPTALILSRSKQHEPDKAPGPGSYQPDYKKTFKAENGFTIGHSDKIADIVGDLKKLPGPGNYETNTSTVISKHAVIIGSEKRSNMVLNNYTPGPGQYQDNESNEFTKKKMPKVVFGKSGRSLSTHNIVPGPGSYAYADNFTDSVNKSKGFSMSFKHNQKNAAAEKQPGPGSYNTEELNRLKHKIVSFSVGKAAKLKIDNEKDLLSMPGPEKYTYVSHTFDSKNGIFSKDKRSSLGNDNHLPGPGAYNAKLESLQPNFSIPRSNTSWLKPSHTPGPGTYEHRIKEANDYNSIRITTDQRRPFYDEKKGIPGPGSYNSSVEKPTQSGFKIGNEKRGDGKTPNNPGPGNYNIPSTISNLPKYTH